MKIERVQTRIPGGAGAELAATLSWPSTGLRGWVLMAHCFTCHRNYKILVWLARRLNAAGFGTMRFDFTGLGESGGDFSHTTFSTNIDDVIAAAAWLTREHGGPDLLFGHSLGGSAMLAAHVALPSARGIATLGTGVQPHRLQRLFQKVAARMSLEPERAFDVEISGRPLPFRRHFLADLARHDLEPTLRSLAVPLLAIHSRQDATTPYESAEELLALAGKQATLVTLDDADHLVSKPEDAERVADAILAWAADRVGL